MVVRVVQVSCAAEGDNQSIIKDIYGYNKRNDEKETIGEILDTALPPCKRIE